MGAWKIEPIQTEFFEPGREIQMLTPDRPNLARFYVAESNVIDGGD